MKKTSNIDPAMAEIADKLVDAEDAKAKAAADIKDIKARAKEDGFNVKLLTQIVREKRKGAQYQCDQLLLELELDTYRKGVGLPTEVKDAQERARREAAAERLSEGSDDGEGGSPFGEGDTVRFGDGPEIPARDFERATKGRRREKLQ